MIDLRSDTVTAHRPMREAMARAEVGDDVYGEDPTVRVLEETVAGLLGKEAALFVPSGTMGNQLAIMTHTRRGDEVVCGEGAHLCWFESGAGAALSGVQFAVAGKGGLFDASEMEAAVKPRAYYYPRTSLVAIENTHNRAGGRVFPREDRAGDRQARARARDLGLHLDGARLWNASAATGMPLAELAGPFDTVSVCFSKGLGAPVGSALAGSKAQIEEAHRLRKMLGGGHAPGRASSRPGRSSRSGTIAARLARRPRARASSSPSSCATRWRPSRWRQPIPRPTSSTSTCRPRSRRRRRARQRAGVLVGAIGPSQLRAVFHLDVNRDSALTAPRRSRARFIRLALT